MSTIELKWNERKISGLQTPRKFLDFIIDGVSFYSPLEHDLISPLGWFVPEYHQKAVARFLLLGPPDFSNDRRSIFVCGECGEPGCGALAAIVERIEDQIIWKDFEYQNDYDPDVTYGDYNHLGPFRFDVNEYTNAFRQAITLNR